MTTQRNGQLAIWVAALVATLWALLRLGDGALGTPPFDSLSELRIWIDASGLAVTVFSLLRLVALAVASYLLLTTALSLVARVSRAGDLIYLADRISVPVVRRMVSGTASLTITAGTVAGAAMPVTATLLVDQRPDLGRSAGDVMLVAAHPVGAGANLDAESPADRAVRPWSTTTDRAHPLAGGEPSRMVVVPESPSAENDHERSNAPRAASTWLVEPGDHLWSIAERTLSTELGTDPHQDAVFDYWRSLVRVNKDRLVNTDNPDLILPGQELLLPTING